MATTGPETSSMACKRRVFRRYAFLNVAFHRFHDYDGIVHDQADRQHQPEQSESVLIEKPNTEKHKRSDERDRDREQRNQGRAPALQKDVDHNDHQQRALQQRSEISFMPSVTAGVVSSETA